MLNPFAIAAAIIAAAMALLWAAPPLLERIELSTLDLRFRARGPLAPGPQVVLAAIDEKSLEAEGRWPWPRARIAALVDALAADRARVIAFDVVFAEPERTPDGDQRLAGAIKGAQSTVVLGYFFHEAEQSLGYRLPPESIAARLALIADSRYPMVYTDPRLEVLPVHRAYAPQTNVEALSRVAAGSGYFSVKSDPDGVVRSIPLVIQAGEDLFPPLSVLAAWHYLGKPPLAVRADRYGVQGVQLGERLVPTDESGRLLIHYRGPAGTIPTYSAGDILAGRLPAGTFRDRIVLVGATATAVGDVRTTPFGPVFPGPELQATMVDNLLAGDFIQRTRVSSAADLAAIVVLGLLAWLAVRRASPLTALLIALALFVTYVAVAQTLFAQARIWLNVVYPSLGLAATYTFLTLYRHLREARERRHIKEAFEHYVAPDVIDIMMRDPAGVRLGGQEQVLTALLSDMEGFTSFSERHKPSEIIDVIGEYYAVMTEQVFAEKGTLVEYVGDELFALFGAPVALADHAGRACACALAMQAQRAALGDAWEPIGRPRIRARTGIHSGTMLVGNIGSKYRFHYGAMGDAVNLASRLEGLNKIYRTQIIVSDQTAELAAGAFRLRELDVVRVKGRTQALRIHELLGVAGISLPAAQEEMLALYGAALATYRERRWDEALRMIEHCLALWAQDGPSALMKRRCLMFKAEPPSADWDGAFQDRRGAAALA